MKEIIILFVCVENSCRSQMAEGWAKEFSRQAGLDFIKAYSAGSNPSGKVNPEAVKVMQEAGVDISGAFSKGFAYLAQKDIDIAVTLGCQDTCPYLPSDKHLQWDVEDPKAKNIDSFRQVRDIIKEKVKTLIKELFYQAQSGGEIMERSFDDALNKLNDDILKMAALAEEAIYKSVESLKNQDKKLAQKVVDDDQKIDELEIAVEEEAIDLLALQQPMARDLRFITTGMKINAELERIADLAVNIAQRVLDVVDKPLVKPLIDIPKLAEVSRKMVKGAIDAFVKRSEDLARQVIMMDPEADCLRNKIYDELINDYMIKDGATAPRAVPLILIARHLERICDHAGYIAADVIYMIKAKVVKHHPERLKNNHS
ncbi:MAG: phosphate signaling complex protein PhoU [Candidatus Omnitrophica bacterium]|nr:phosphate signaling complex protein PhoU [Candidatus Omnitrophota bacterium]